MDYFPERLSEYDSEVILCLPQKMTPSGRLIRSYLRNISKEYIPLYFKNISFLHKEGVNRKNLTLINNVGKWVFGVPGFKGHIRVSNWDNECVSILYPSQSPKEVHDLVSAIKLVAENVIRDNLHNYTPGNCEDLYTFVIAWSRRNLPRIASIEKIYALARVMEEITFSSCSGYGGPSVRDFLVKIESFKEKSFGESLTELSSMQSPIFRKLECHDLETIAGYYTFDNDVEDFKFLLLNNIYPEDEY